MHGVVSRRAPISWSPHPGFEASSVSSAIAAHRDPIERNRAFNAAYQGFARDLQALIGTRPEVLPNWFAVGAHASPQVGRSMIAARRALEAISLLEKRNGAPSREALFDHLALRGPSRALASTIARALDVFTTGETATALACFVSALTAANGAAATSGLLDPRVGIAVAHRLLELLEAKKLFFFRKDATLERAAALCRTYVSLLAEGNTAIFGDIGRSCERFLALGERDPESVLEKLTLPESSLAGSRRVYIFALENSTTDFSQLSRPGQGNDLVRAGFALYALASRTRDIDRENTLIARANNLIAWREQFESVDGAFRGRAFGELDRGSVLSALTPLVQLPIGRSTWRFSTYASRLRDRDQNPLTAPASEYDWSKFRDRWPAILDAFRFAYARPEEVWRFPPPL